MSTATGQKRRASSPPPSDPVPVPDERRSAPSLNTPYTDVDLQQLDGRSLVHILQNAAREIKHRLAVEQAEDEDEDEEVDDAVAVEGADARSTISARYRAASTAPSTGDRPAHRQPSVEVEDLTNAEIYEILESFAPDPTSRPSRDRLTSRATHRSKRARTDDWDPHFEPTPFKPIFRVGRYLPDGTDQDLVRTLYMIHKNDGSQKVQTVQYPANFRWESKEMVTKLNKSCNQIWYRNVGKCQEQRPAWTEEEIEFLVSVLEDRPDYPSSKMAVKFAKRFPGGIRRSEKAIDYVYSKKPQVRRAREGRRMNRSRDLRARSWSSNSPEPVGEREAIQYREKTVPGPSMVVATGRVEPEREQLMVTKQMERRETAEQEAMELYATRMQGRVGQRAAETVVRAEPDSAIQYDAGKGKEKAGPSTASSSTANSATAVAAASVFNAINKPHILARRDSAYAEAESVAESETDDNEDVDMSEHKIVRSDDEDAEYDMVGADEAHSDGDVADGEEIPAKA